MNLALLGFLMVATFMTLIMTKRMTPLVALIVVPTAFALFAGPRLEALSPRPAAEEVDRLLTGLSLPNARPLGCPDPGEEGERTGLVKGKPGRLELAVRPALIFRERRERHDAPVRRLQPALPVLR